MLIYWIILGLLVVVAGAIFIGSLLVVRERALDRLFTMDTGGDVLSRWQSAEASIPRLTLFLARAGYRKRGAALRFLAATSICAGVGAILAARLVSDPYLREMLAQPGPVAGIGELYLTMAALLPWFLFLGLALLPTLVVRASRRRVVNEVEQDLPIILDLLATLGEVGLGLDAAIARILDAHPIERTVTREFRIFQLEGLAGLSRVRCLRRLAQRLDVTAVSILVSALAQAEQTGSGWASVLRRQADDLRNRRREKAMADAHTLPVKLTVPLAIGFLPSIFIWTLGPALQQFIEMAERVIR